MSSAARCLPLSAALLCLYIHSASSVSFSLDFSKSSDNPCGQDLVCKGAASFRNTMIELTNSDPTTLVSQGRVWYGTPVPLWDAITGEVASFTTTFSFNIKWMEGSPDWGDGMAFFLSPFSRDTVLADTYGGGILGLFKYGDQLDATGDSQVVAVEFDTCLNPEWDSSGQHVGIDVNSIKSVSYANTSNAAKNLTSGFTMTAKIHYDNGTKLLAADLQINDTFYHVNRVLNLREILPEEIAIGFSAGTALNKELHQILSWSFNSTLEEKAAAPTPNPTGTQPAQAPAAATINSKPSSKPQAFIFSRVLFPVAASVLVIAILVGFLVWLRRRRPTETVEANGGPAAEFDFEIGIVGPRRYTYRDLAAATNNFAERNKLGEGGFGSVYKGRLRNDADGGHLLVAIKRFSSSASSASQSHQSQQGRKEFEAEVRIISRLSHRNLVQLLGWSDSPKGLLLVYELVPKGSLDEHIHSNNKLLTWPERYNIILGLGSALRYLHLDWEQCVVHGDIKPRNIMLDASLNTKLGDFGLARLVEHGAGPQTTGIIQGTVGYIDPEFVNTFQRSTQSDVYSFGIVLLEIVSGRLPANRQEPSFMLPKWVWSLYSQDLTLEAVDARLRGDGDDDVSERQMVRALVVGLWCAHPDPAQRPSMAQAMHVLQSEDARLPELSPQMYRQQVAPPSFGAGESSASGTSLSSGVRS